MENSYAGSVQCVSHTSVEKTHTDGPHERSQSTCTHHALWKMVIKSEIEVQTKGAITSRVKEGGIFQTLQEFFRFQRLFRFEEEEEEGKTMHILQ